MQQKVFRAYVDSGHGWIAVKRSLLSELGILDKITPYSYQNGGTVYLEEDCDAATFVAAYEKKYGEKPAFTEKYSHTSHVRYYPNFKLEG